MNVLALRNAVGKEAQGPLVSVQRDHGLARDPKNVVFVSGHFPVILGLVKKKKKKEHLGIQ